jgi:hypothetical protein
MTARHSRGHEGPPLDFSSPREAGLRGFEPRCGDEEEDGRRFGEEFLKFFFMRPFEVTDFPFEENRQLAMGGFYMSCLSTIKF